MDNGLFLTDAEVARICEPLVQPAAQVRYLRRLGLKVETKPNGRALVVRRHAEAVLSGTPAVPQRDIDVERPSAGPTPDRFFKLIGRERAA